MLSRRACSLLPLGVSSSSSSSLSSRPSFFRSPCKTRRFHHCSASLGALNTINMSSDIKQVFSKDAAPPAGPYSHAIIAGSQIFVSGQIPADKEGNLIEGSIADKTKACCENIRAILKEAGVGVERVIKVNVFLDDMAHFAEMNSVYQDFFVHRPARSCVAVKQLPKGVPVEIECIAFAG